MSLYRVIVRRTSSIEFDMLIEARSRAEALRLAEDPSEWLEEPDYERIRNECEEIDEVRAMSAEEVVPEEGEG